MNVMVRLVELATSLFKLWWSADDLKRADIEIAATEILLKLADLRAKMEPPP
jgi:hypothetical protein